jgi:hypothetical protein
MTTIIRTYIKTALSYALVGTLLSTVWLIQLAWPIHPLLAFLQPTALHLLVVGWLTQLIIGIAIWLFPPWSKQQPRGPESLAWLCYGVLNGGLLVRLVAEPLNGYHPTALLGWLLVSSAVMQVGALWLFIYLVWGRVRAKGTRS